MLLEYRQELDDLKNENTSNVRHSKRIMEKTKKVATITKTGTGPIWERIGPEFNLYKRTDRLQLVFFSLNIARVFHCFSDENLFSQDVSLPFRFGVEEKRKGDPNIRFRINYNQNKSGIFFSKKILDTQLLKSANFNHLKDLYELLKENKIKNTYTSFEYQAIPINSNINSYEMCFFTPVYDNANVGIKNLASLIKALEDVSIFFLALCYISQKTFILILLESIN